MAVVNFDVDIGHVIETLVECPGFTLSVAERDQLPLCAMPDTQPSSEGAGLGDVSFAFRFNRRVKPGPVADGTQRGSLWVPMVECTLATTTTEATSLWGFSFYRAHRDTSCKRGVFQKALVLLTSLPMFELWRWATRRLALRHLEAPSRESSNDSSVDNLRAALAEMLAWPSPTPALRTPILFLAEMAPPSSTSSRAPLTPLLQCRIVRSAPRCAICGAD